MRVLRAALGAALLGVVCASVPGIGAAQAPLADDVKSESCELGTSLTSGPLPDDGRTLAFRVLVLLDGPTPERGREVLAEAARSYAPLNIELRPKFRSVEMVDTSAGGLITEARRMFGGVVPKGFDAVHVFTTKPIAGWGLASCIEGVRTTCCAFSVSEEAKGQAPKITGEQQMPWLWGELTAKVVAHELGHLMGGQHHLANCVEGVTAPDIPRPCTLMDTSLTMSPNFSTANATVVRQVGLRYLPDA